MLGATVLALGAAVLHAGWNLAVKQSGDRFITLWGQFFVAGVMCGAVLLAVGGVPATAWVWAAASGLVHVPYCWFLARAYDHGDFSLVYPVARGGGALLAAIGGIALLGDELSGWAVGAIVLVAAGLFMLAGRASGPELSSAVVVAAVIGAYSVFDAQGIRSTGTPAYALATFVATAVTTTAFGLVSGRRSVMVSAMRAGWRRFAAIGLAVSVTYGMVQIAFQWAPVGYVTALRESSVVLAAFAGWRMLGESAGTRRLVSSGVVVSGLVLLVVAR